MLCVYQGEGMNITVKHAFVYVIPFVTRLKHAVCASG